MSKDLKEITVLVSRTFNLGNFESCRVECSLSASLDGRTPEKAAEEMIPHIRKSLLVAFNDHVNNRGKGKDLE